MCLLLVVAWSMTGCSSAPPTPEKPKTAYEQWQDANFSVLDGSNKQLVAKIKPLLKDPDSFKHLETKFTEPDSDGNVHVRMTFTATNSFGGRISYTATADINIKTNVLTNYHVSEN